MKERPILFSGPMVRAILEGRKSQTRRVIKPVQPRDDGMWPAWRDPVSDCPYGQTGDLLWVRETWRIPGDSASNRATDSTCTGPEDVDFAAEFSGFDFDIRKPWRPSIFMPRWASRLTLRITNVRVERLQEISEYDCFGEGVSSVFAGPQGQFSKHPIAAYHEIWESINGKGSWDANPWIWVIEFERVEQQRAAA